MVGRIPVMNVTPLVDLGRQPAKATVGEPFPVTATVFREGHDKLGAEVVLTGPDGERRPPVRMTKHAEIPDRYEAWVTPDVAGAWTFEVVAWSDPLATWQHNAAIKVPAGVDVELMFTEGRILLEQVLESLDPRDPSAADAALVLQGAIDAAVDTHRPPAARLAVLEAPEVTGVLATHPIRELVTVEGPYPAYADRREALFSSWYEFFPRSEGATKDRATGKVTSGNFRTAAKRLDAVAAMGFDVIYLPPVHPIGEVNRKGPNNTLDPGPDDTGSPWAIGSKDGGHDAIHPDLGTFEDFDAFVARAREVGLEVALDLALQAAPDHPWVQSHPEWFTTRADGSIAYAENPPKKYQDIYPLNFDNDPEGLSREILRAVLLWAEHGVRLFRVDTPHTKPPNFWHWLIWQVKARYPDVLFLAEAFTRPARLFGLARLGFTQSYTYFTGRPSKAELTEFALMHAERCDEARPNLFVNTPDILHESLQHGGRAMFAIRAALAATMAPSWGVYSGFELYEGEAVKPGSEEYLNSEKYELRPRDFEAAAARGDSLEPYITRLNEIRKAHPALQQLRDIHFHHVDNDQLIAYSKTDPKTGDTVLVVCTLDSWNAQEGTTALDMPALGADWADQLTVFDEVTGDTYTWGQFNFVRLEPWNHVAHIFRVTR